MTIDYLLQEDGFKIDLEDGSGSLLLESSTAIVVLSAREDINVMVHGTGDLSVFTHGSDDSKIYLNSLQDIGVVV
jgi:hypothetical protein